MINVTLTEESINTIIGLLDKDMERINEEANAWELCAQLGDSKGLERHHARWLDLKTEHMGKLIGLRLALRYSESLTIDGKLYLDASITYNDITRKHELRGF